jgi:hypothetical protein
LKGTYYEVSGSAVFSISCYLRKFSVYERTSVVTHTKEQIKTLTVKPANRISEK